MLLQMLKCVIHLVSKSVIFNTTLFYYPYYFKDFLGTQENSTNLLYVHHTEGRP